MGTSVMAGASQDITPHPTDTTAATSAAVGNNDALAVQWGSISLGPDGKYIDNPDSVLRIFNADGSVFLNRPAELMAYTPAMVALAMANAGAAQPRTKASSATSQSPLTGAPMDPAAAVAQVSPVIAQGLAALQTPVSAETATQQAAIKAAFPGPLANSPATDAPAPNAPVVAASAAAPGQLSPNNTDAPTAPATSSRMWLVALVVVVVLFLVMRRRGGA